MDDNLFRNSTSFPSNLLKIVALFIISCFSSPFNLHVNVQAQEIDFGQFSSKYGITLTELNPSTDLSFGTLIQNEGAKSIPISEAKVVSIEGVKYLDAIVEVIGEEYLYLNGDNSCTDSSCRIPFTLQAAYSNAGENDFNQAVIMQVLGGNIATAQFPILRRQNQPPGPPPTPDHEGYNPSLYNETAYLYIYGSINVGNVNGGSYSSQITINVTYD